MCTQHVTIVFMQCIQSETNACDELHVARARNATPRRPSIRLFYFPRTLCRVSSSVVCRTVFKRWLLMASTHIRRVSSQTCSVLFTETARSRYRARSLRARGESVENSVPGKLRGEAQMCDKRKRHYFRRLLLKPRAHEDDGRTLRGRGEKFSA